MFEGIGKFFTQIFEAIIGFFKGLFGLNDKTEQSAAASTATGAAVAPDGPSRSQAVGQGAPSQTAAQPPAAPPQPLVDDETRQTIQNAIQGNPPRDSAAPVIFEQDQQGRLVVNIPQDARVEIRQSPDSVAMPGRDTMYTVTVQPSFSNRDVFNAEQIEIPGSVLENAQAVFKAPNIGRNDIQFERGKAPAGTALVVESEGAEIKNRGVDAFVNGNLQADANTETQARRRPAPPPQRHTPPQDPQQALMNRFAARREHILSTRAEMSKDFGSGTSISSVVRDRENDIISARNQLRNAFHANVPPRPYLPNRPSRGR